jgi:hypothetical protein
MRIAFTIIWTFAITFIYLYWYYSTHHHRPPTGMTGIIAFLAWGSAYGIIYLYHKSKKDSGDDGPSTWL